jgi:hypothetical protein
MDDTFGATQLDCWQMTMQWNATFAHVRAAVRRDAEG